MIRINLMAVDRERVKKRSKSQITQHVAVGCVLILVVAGALVVAAYTIILPVTAAATLPTAGAIPLAFAMALIGLFVCVTGRDVLSQVLGFLVFENGIFGPALLATYGLPSLVEAGVFLDVLVIVLLMEGMVMQSRREHDSIDVDRLRELRG